jgi:hypothetical protein
MGEMLHGEIIADIQLFTSCKKVGLMNFGKDCFVFLRHNQL